MVCLVAGLVQVGFCSTVVVEVSGLVTRLMVRLVRGSLISWLVGLVSLVSWLGGSWFELASSFGSWWLVRWFVLFFGMWFGWFVARCLVRYVARCLVRYVARFLVC